MELETLAPAAEPVAAEPAQQQEVATPESEAQAEPTTKEVEPVQKRINQLTRKAHEAERRANAAIMAHQQAEQRAQALEQRERDAQRRATMPTPEQHGLDPVQYQRAVEAHNERYLNEQKQAFQAQWDRHQQEQVMQSFEQRVQARVAEGNQKFADFDDVVGNPNLPSLRTRNPILLAAIMDHDRAADITYYLGKNPTEAHRIADMPPARAILEVGAIAGRLPSTTRQTSKAPAPPPEVGGSSTASKEPKDMNYDEYVKWRRGKK